MCIHGIGNEAVRRIYLLGKTVGDVCYIPLASPRIAGVEVE